MNLGITLPTVGPPSFREFILPVAKAAEDLGFHSVWTNDHVVFPKTRQSHYPYQTSTTEVTFSRGIAWLDPVGVLGIVGGATERITIGTSVMVLPYRSPVVVANEISTLDRLTEGRITLGIGVGWMDEEFEALGIPKSERGPRTDEYIAVLRALWSNEFVEFDGKFVQLDQVTLGAPPHQEGGPPIIIGGNSKPALRRAGRLGDGWHGFEVLADAVPEKIEAVIRSAEEAGRNPAMLQMSARRGLVPPFPVSDFLSDRVSIRGDAGEVAKELRAYEEAGINLIVLDLAMLPAESVKTMEWIASKVVPQIG